MPSADMPGQEWWCCNQAAQIGREASALMQHEQHATHQAQHALMWRSLTLAQA